MKPLEGLLVIDFSQFLAGPSAGLRLSDLGARVIKIERPQDGDLCRQLYVTDVNIDGDSSLFHAINRSKESYAADLKDRAGLERVRRLAARADVVIQNFRPGVAERLGIDYSTLAAANPRLIYASITGYGRESPWSGKPGQDLLLQAISGLAWLNGSASDPPVPFGLAVIDMFAGSHAVQGILACLVRRGITGKGGIVDVSMLESSLDMQFEVLTTYLNDGRRPPQRAAVNSAHAYLSAPYGIYETADGYLALAMQPIVRLGQLIGCAPLLAFDDPGRWFTERDIIKRILADHLRRQTTAYWLTLLEPADIWCADVLTWDRLMASDGFRELQMIQTVTRANGVQIETTRMPFRIDGERYFSAVGSPAIGQDNARIDAEFGLRLSDSNGDTDAEDPSFCPAEKTTSHATTGL
jgi:crotonobetainyl-CoA:carnitine CoA-transferase CaiB-like acyl-CoA transferase